MFIRVPYYFGDQKGNPNSENYPNIASKTGSRYGDGPVAPELPCPQLTTGPSFMHLRIQKSLPALGDHVSYHIQATP